MCPQALGTRMEAILRQQTADRFSVIEQVKEESKKKQLKTDDDEEDFMDEGTHALIGSAVRYACSDWLSREVRRL